MYESLRLPLPSLDSERRREPRPLRVVGHETPEPQPRVWAFLGRHRGDNNQVLALAEALGLPFEAKSLSYNRWRNLEPQLLGASLISLAPESRPIISGDPPDLIISAGHRSVPVVQFVRRQSGGRTRTVHVGHPRLSPEHFDLVVSTPEYPIPDHPNLLRIPFALSRAMPEEAASEADAALLAAFPEPRRLIVLGGATHWWRIDRADVHQALAHLIDRAAVEGGSVLAVGSPRTPGELLSVVEQILADAEVPAALFPTDGPPAFRSLLKAADQLFVTADSVAMVSDAIATRKPVGLVPIKATRSGRLLATLARVIPPNRRAVVRDLRLFWEELDRRGLAGTVTEPNKGVVPDLTAQVAARVMRMLETHPTLSQSPVSPVAIAVR